MSTRPDAAPDPSGLRALVLTVDQRDSRTSPDAVGPVLRMLADLPVLLPFQRTAGDEFQGVLDDPAALPHALEILLRDGRWHVGLGLGEVETPLPEETREARGPAFVAAREAVSTTRNAPWGLRVVGESPLARHLESACWLWGAVLGRRTAKGWEVADLVDEGTLLRGCGTAPGRLPVGGQPACRRSRPGGVPTRPRAGRLPRRRLAGVMMAPVPMTTSLTTTGSVVLLLLTGAVLVALLGWRLRGNPWLAGGQLVLLLTVGALAALHEPFAASSAALQSLTVALCAALALTGGGPATTAVFRLVDGPGADRAGSMRRAAEVLRGGAWIGVLERTAIFAAVVSGWPEGIAISLALKGLGRYPELRNQERTGIAERFLIGTFVSVLWAAGCAGVALLLIG